MASSLTVLFFIPSFVLSSLCHALPREAAFDVVDVLLDSSVGARIPTTLPGQSLTVTTSPSDCATFINNIKLTPWSIYDDVEKLAIKWLKCWTNDWVPVQSKVAAMEAGHWRR
ncbi:hypothetical protein LR48_Vigan04g005900 [Vigna angularis]|uniref:Uncharacterized protein n=1 Tax=Phaseolus angularis TaxID=3914 RepID=A0A0L9UAX8_PHAAN|nr:hypothetical protein LR48_Vigan04g005900 [Vigna angularis]